MTTAEKADTDPDLDAPAAAAGSGAAGGWGPLDWARWAWRQLTAMRTALFLLFLLAVAAIPGSLLPQRPVDPGRVAAYALAHKQLAPVLDRLALFDVYASPWFASVYLLLMVSLVGCVVPRTVRHATVLRRQPPPAPRNLGRLPLHEEWDSTATRAEALAAAHQALRGRRYRVLVDGDAVRAEKGRIRESGNLAFHLALLGVLAGIAVSSLFGIKGEALLVQGSQFVNQPGAYDSLTPGPLASLAGLPPFSVRLDDFTATYQTAGPQRGAPISFRAATHVQTEPGSPATPTVVQVNHPLSVDGFKMFLTGHGYAPVVQVKDAAGRLVYDGPTVFIPQDGMMTSTGVIKVPDVRPQQLGFSGLFLPTAARDPGRGLISVFPAADAPALVLTGYAGDLGINTGASQSVYTLNTKAMTQLGTQDRPWSVALTPGRSASLPGGRGTITFVGVREYAAFRVSRDRGGPIVLAAVCVALAGLVLALGVRQRRVWVRVRPSNSGCHVELAALPRNQAPGTRAEFTAVALQLRTLTAAHPADDVAATT